MRQAYRKVQQELAAVNAGVEQGVSSMQVIISAVPRAFTVEQIEGLSLRNLQANLKASVLFAAIPDHDYYRQPGDGLVLGYGGIPWRRHHDYPVS